MNARASAASGARGAKGQTRVRPIAPPSLARAAAEAGGTAPAVLNAANEVAVAAFLDQRLRFDQIHAINDATLQALIPSKPNSLPDLLAIDQQARRLAQTQVERLSR